jgi:hypothetical protein
MSFEHVPAKAERNSILEDAVALAEVCAGKLFINTLL